MTKSLAAEFHVRPGYEQRVRQLVLELTTAVRGEPGNLLFLPFVSAADPRHYTIFEMYEDENAFRAHLATEHGTAFNEALAGLIEGDGSTLNHFESIEAARADA